MRVLFLLSFCPIAMTDLLGETDHPPSAARQRRPRRLQFLLLAGIVAVLLAVGFRYSPWAREYQLRRASLAELRTMATDSPRDPLVLYHLGAKAYNARSLGEAGYCFENASRLDPKMARAFVGLATVQRDIGRWEEAYASAKQAQSLSPRNPDVQFLIAMLVMHASQLKAIPEFQAVTRLAPKRADAWYWLGISQWGVNQKGEAVTSLRKAVALESNPLYLRDLGELLIEMGSFADALEPLTKAEQGAKGDPHVYYLLGKARLRLARNDADLEQAETDFAHAESLLGPPDADNTTGYRDLASARADLATRREQPELALKYLVQARKVDPNDLQLLYQHSEALRRVGKLPEARRLMEEYQSRSALANEVFQMTERVKQDPKNPALRLKMARLFARNKDRARAINQYEYCLYLNPLQADARRELKALKP